MNERKLISFAPFLLDVENEKLWLDGKEIPLRPKAFAVLRRLMENDHLPVSVDELLKTVWTETDVSKGVVKGCIREIRKALG